jgi:hypothetical protein
MMFITTLAIFSLSSKLVVPIQADNSRSKMLIWCGWWVINSPFLVMLVLKIHRVKDESG